jgi:hypothetical protein
VDAGSRTFQVKGTNKYLHRGKGEVNILSHILLYLLDPNLMVIEYGRRNSPDSLPILVFAVGQRRLTKGSARWWLLVWMLRSYARKSKR